MKKLSKILALVLALTMVAALFVGCNQAKPNETNASGEPVATGGDKPSGEKTILKVEIWDRGKAYKDGATLIDNEAIDWINKEFGEPNNIEVQFIPVPRSEEVQKLNLLMAGKTAPDIVYTYDVDLFFKYAQDGGLADLTPYVDQCPNIKKAMESSTWGRYDGKIMSIDTGMYMRGKYMHGQFGNYIRKDWLDKLGLEVPKNADELFEVLKAFRDADPKLLGVDKVIPWGMAGGYSFKDEDWQQDSLNALFAFVEPMTDEEKATLPYLKMPGYKEGARFLNKCFNEKLIDQDFALQNDTKIFWQQIANGQTGFWSIDVLYNMTDKGHYGTLFNTIPDAEVLPINCFPNSEGKYPHRTGAGNDVQIMVPSFSKNVEAAMKYIDFIMDYENGIRLRYGVEGKNYEMKDGVLSTKGMEPINWGAEFYPRVWPLYDDEETWLTQDKFNVSPKMLDLIVAAKKAAMVDMWTPFHYDRPLEMQAKHVANLDKKFQDTMIKSIVAAPADFDKTFDAGVEEYMAMGGQDVLDEKIDAYRDMMSKK